MFAPVCMSWFPIKRKAHVVELAMGERVIALATVRGSVILWNIATSSHRMLVQRTVPTKLSVGDTRQWKDSHRPTVLRCNLHPVSGEIAVGFKDGRIELVSVHQDVQTPVAFFYEKGCDVGKTSQPKSAQRTGRVVDLQWDPFSPNYLLAAYADCDEVVLWDCLEKIPRVVQTFPLENRTRAVAGLAWQSWAPGNFTTVSEKGAGLMHVWNVSQKTPIETLRISNGSAGVAMSAWGSLCLIGLENGAMVTYDAQRRLQLLTTRPSHRETVFDVRFRPSNLSAADATAESDEDREFATCSFDGRVIIYGARDKDCRRTLKHKDKPVIYGVSWAPAPRRWIASCTYTGVLSIWDVAPLVPRLLSSVKLHKGPTYRVDWNKCEPSLIATSSADRFAVISEINLEDGSLKVRQRLEHPAKTFGCAWAPFYSDKNPWLATGCGNGVVYVWNAMTAKVGFKLTKHEAKIFNVTWSPLRTGVLASGSDDRTIIVWKLPLNETSGATSETKGKQATVIEPQICLRGHSMNVRALLWSTEIPSLLLSGSWDGSIRAWDTDKGVCLASIYDHHADVYGLDLDPERPFTVLSSSRDTTIRVWDLVKPVEVVQAKLELLCEIIFEGRLPARTQNAAEHALRGRAGRQLLQRIRYATSSNHDMDADNKVDLLRDLFFFFGERPGMHDLFKLLADDTSGTRVVHAASRVLLHHDEQLPSNDEERAVSLIKSGRLRSACEALRRAGRWERALALAPAVSLAYWRSLATEYGRSLAESHDEEAPTFLMAAGHVSEAIRFHKDRHEFDAAMVLAQAGIERSAQESQITMQHAELPPQHNEGDLQRAALAARKRRDALAHEQAHMFLESGRPLLAACAMLAVDDTHAAIQALMLAGIPELALCVAKVRVPQHAHENILKAVAAKCERYGCTELALQLYRKTSNPSREAHLMCARVNFPKPVRQGLGLRQPLQYLQQAQELLTRRDKGRDVSLCQTLELLCASGDVAAQAQAVQLGTEEACRLLKHGQAWDIDRVREITRILQCVDLEATISPEHARNRDLLLALCCFVGALDAIWKRLDPIVLPLFRALRAILREHPDLGFPVHLEAITAREVEFRIRSGLVARGRKEAMDVFAAAETLIAKTLTQSAEEPSTSQQAEARMALSRAADHLEEARAFFQQSQLGKDDGASPDLGEKNSIEAVACEMSNVALFARGLPNGNTRSGRRSMFDNKIIRGPCVRLPGGDGQFFLSLPHALMWDEVNAYSPLNNGALLFPSRYHVAQQPPTTNAFSPKAMPAATSQSKKGVKTSEGDADACEPETKSVRVH
ncbi:WD repeat-containing protein 17 [Hondaea fermentalgiana]|uniref:WD repeat-containing protein 17 n=1 Tax=Hondaea fermentalgiana TaxID=2315210 RepID=A0A2R5G128_9STRA|nr:WD repeat-containing protein 17 [Hondaea fermentalgiana]|eukprot:GBG24710.1 WD repeat-containing protein 17 [Hondaea fermentalgiana]